LIVLAIRWDLSAKHDQGHPYDDRGEIEDSTLTMRGRSLKIDGECLRFAGSFSTAAPT
jgi:hypothetical protein